MKNKRKKYLWIRKDDTFWTMMNNYEVTGLLGACNWHECECLDDKYVRVTIDWDQKGERNKVVDNEQN